MAFGTERLPADRPPHSGRTLKCEYGLRPDLLAVTNVWEQAGTQELIAAAKGAPEAIAELCQLPGCDHVQLRRGVDVMAHEGMRVLAVARASVPAENARPEDRSSNPR